MGCSDARDTADAIKSIPRALGCAERTVEP